MPVANPVAKFIVPEATPSETVTVKAPSAVNVTVQVSVAPVELSTQLGAPPRSDRTTEVELNGSVSETPDSIQLPW